MSDIKDSSHNELHFLYDIIKDERNSIRRDATTQTKAIEYQQNTDIKSTIKKKYPCRRRNSPKNLYSSFRLFIVPDNESSKEFEYSVVTDDKNSCRISIKTPENTKISNVVPAPTKKHVTLCPQKPLGYKYTALKQPTKHNVKDTEDCCKDEVKSTSERWLRDSTNPSLLAWLRMKNSEEKQKRRTKRQEKRELRKVALDKAEMIERRKEESATRYSEWLRHKRHEEKRVMRLKRSHRKVSAVRPTEDPEEVAPENYTIIPTFKGTEAWKEVQETSNSSDIATKEEIRPKTSICRRDKTTRLKKRPKTSCLTENETNKKLTITYEAWVDRKRVESKEKAKQKKREVVDEALTQGILKMARKRIEHIYEKPKEVDTGLSKWRAKHRGDNKCVNNEGTREEFEEIKNMYSLPENTEKERTKTHNKSKDRSIIEEIETIRKFCENVDITEDSLR